MRRHDSVLISYKMFSLVEGIGLELGLISVNGCMDGNSALCRDSVTRIVHSSLALEGNSLSLGDVVNLFDGRLVMGPKKDIRDVENGFKVYRNLRKWDVFSEESFWKVCSIFMDTDRPQYREGVRASMKDLFEFIGKSKVPWLLKACIFHYEMMRIQPFAQENGRMARVWQQLLLMCASFQFEYVPVDQAIMEHRDEYYGQMAAAFESGGLTQFFETALDVILFALVYYVPRRAPLPVNYEERMTAGMRVFEGVWFTRKEYGVMLEVSDATASRDLARAASSGRLIKQGESASTKYRY